MPITRWGLIEAGVLVGIAAAAADAIVETFFIETKKFFIPPATSHTENIKIIQVSDLHLQSINFRVKRLADRINRLNPHLVLITGDTIDKAGNLPLLDRFLKLIDNHSQKAAILGNWEYQGKVELSE